VVWLIIPALLVIFVAIPLGFHPNPAGTVVLLAIASLITAMVSAISGALGIKLRQIGSLAAVVTGLQLPLMLLSGILLPLSLAPSWMVVLAHIDPMYYAVEASRVLANGSIVNGTVVTAFGALGVLTALSLWWATGVYRKALA